MSGLTNPKVRGARGLGRFEFSKAPSSRSSRLIQKVNRKPHFTTATTMDEEHIEKPKPHCLTGTTTTKETSLGEESHKHKEIPVKEEEGEVEGERRAYGVWVSEVMLQQTRVQTVIDYYNRWMLKWPTLHHLAQASLEEVNEMWAGLGYYRRARFLLEGARMIVAGGDGFPKIVSSLLKVPWNRRLYSWCNCLNSIQRSGATNPKDKVTVKKFWKLAAQLVDPHRPGDFNQSLMELGATLCTPLNPSCSSCPVSGECRALAISKLDKQELIEGDQSNSVFLLVKRPDEGLLAGLWEFPSVMLGKEAALTRRRKEMNCFLKKSFRLDPQRTCSILLREDVGEFTHIFSHIRLKVYVELLIVHLKDDMSDLFSMRDGENTTWKCVDREALSSLGLTSGVRKVYTMVQKFKQNRLSTASAAARKRTNSKKSGLS
ncbi:ADENINE DNA GLYCOSYLASE [Salix purpurea]|uniref:Adenine DNA glycosylase n=1 Tax=Salix purpurea TaxID=77065 RepID=A0A9Q0SKT3_SALPP|nr:ADENINE DNA GLYCOSYLASE [Salix purpurea]